MTLDDKIALHISKLSSLSGLLPGVVTVHHLVDHSLMWMCERGLNLLDISLDDLIKLSGKDYHEKFFNPEDADDYVPKLFGLLNRNNNEECVSFFQQVKIKRQTVWTWHLSSSRILMRDDDDKPILMITQAFPIESLESLALKAERTLQENTFLKENRVAFSKLSEREIEVLTCLANGESSMKCGEQLFISSKTVETHRKNIRKKLGIKSFAELSYYARAFDLI